jgi:UV DNA damage endonuclease
MNKIRLGYCCINNTLANSKDKVYTGRGVQQKRFLAEGTNVCSELATQNCKDLYRILAWNKANNITLFRIGSEIFPWGTKYNLEDLRNFAKISELLKLSGDYAKKYGMRLTFHPDHFVKLASFDDDISQNSINELEMHSRIFDLMGFMPSNENCINIHVGAVYDDRQTTMDNFCRNFDKLSPNLQKRLTVENDDKASLYTTEDLYEGVFKRTGVPIVFDYHHHSLCNRDNTTAEDSLKLAATTWGDTRQLVHYSESRSLEYRDPTIKPQAHSDFYVSHPDTFDMTLDIDLECKMKETALLKMRKDFPEFEK